MSIKKRSVLPLQKWCSSRRGGSARARAVAVRGVRSRVSGGSRLDTLVPGRGTVDTHRFADITVTRLEDAFVIVSRHVPGATHHVVDMLAIGAGFRADACADAELIRAHEVGPLMELLSGAKDVAVNETTDGVAVTVGAMVVELASLVARGDVNLGEVTLAGDLDVLGRLDKVDAVEGARRYHAGAVDVLGAVGDHLSLSVTDCLDNGRTPQAEVINGVEPEGLAIGAGRRAGTTVVVTSLTDLRLVGEVVGEVTDVPHLIAVAPATIPDLNSVTVCELTVCEIQATAVVRPGKVIVAGPPPLLVDALWPTIPDLELHTIRINPVRGVQALSASIGSDGAVFEGPELVITAGAVTDDHGGAIGVAILGCQTLCVVSRG